MQRRVEVRIRSLDPEQVARRPRRLPAAIDLLGLLAERQRDAEIVFREPAEALLDERGVSLVDLPKNNLLNEYSVKGESVQLAINKSGDIYFKGEIFPKNKWPLLFAKCINSEYSIVLNADRQLNVEKLLPILDELKSYNCENVFFATVQE